MGLVGTDVATQLVIEPEEYVTFLWPSYQGPTLWSTAGEYHTVSRTAPADLSHQHRQSGVSGLERPTVQQQGGCRRLASEAPNVLHARD